MTNHWVDLKNTDCALIIGSNCAENHPMAFKWLTVARERRGAKIIHVDPRFCRTSARSDIYAPMRSGTDIAFIGGLINYIIQNNLFAHDYVANYTNAAMIVDDGFSFNDGIFSGYDPKKRSYDQKTWVYKADADKKPLRDLTLQDPRCIFQLLKKHYERYDIDTVCKVTGTPKDVFLTIAATFAATAAPDKAGTICYAMGTCQHTVASQNVRIYAMLQLLLGNIGIPGGGVNAMRGESNVQGACDMGLLEHLLTAYMNAPTNNIAYKDLAGYNKKETPAWGWKLSTPKWIASMLKAWYGNAATKANDFCYQYLPKKDESRNYTHIGLFEAMYSGSVKGLLCFGSNPVVSGPDANKEAKALQNLDWMVAADLWETETSAFWKSEAEVDPYTIKTEVFFLPAAASFEKQGTISNSGRWVQFRWKAVNPVGEARSDLEIFYDLGNLIKKAYTGSNKLIDKPIQDMTWNYGPDEAKVLDDVQQEINGFNLVTGQRLAKFADLKEDGSTSSGVWIYCGMYPAEMNKTQRRSPKDTSGIGQYPGWAWAWPVDRRIIYNRCSADLEGKPWSEAKKVVWFDPAKADPTKNFPKGQWTGLDVPDFVGTVAPSDPDGGKPFIMSGDGYGGLFAKMKDGPFPEHYEPWETPTQNLLSSVQLDPAVRIFNKTDKEKEMNTRGTPDQFPIVGTSYRVVEHWQAGAMTRNLPWLAELMPNSFVEISEELAKEKGIKNGDTVTVVSARGKATAVACVTKRFKPFNINGKTVHEIGILWHYGFRGVAVGDPANRLTPHIGDANSTTPEYKAWLCDVHKGVR